MSCRIAENEPLKKLRSEFNLLPQCHSLRTDDCIHKLDKPTGNYAMGIPGAALGYCQALFIKNTDPKSNTENILDLLGSIKAPWYKSHELYWGNKADESVKDFITLSIQPLLGTGRMPILISPLDPKNDFEIIKEILYTDPLMFEGETTLVRIVLSDDESVNSVAILMQEVLKNAREKDQMPKFWPLLQGQIGYREWQHLMDLMGNDWKYLNIAVNPFTIDSLPEICWEQVTVAQVVVGHMEGMSDDGDIHLPKGMKIAGAKECDDYNIFDFFTKLENLEVAPTLIVLGPSLPDWSDQYNLQRIERLLPLLRKSCNQLWRALSDRRKNMVWELTA